MAKRILMVDDELDFVSATKLYLEEEGYEVIGVDSGHEAILLLRDPGSLPDLIILDVRMPRLSGWDVLRMVRDDYVTRDIPVIMLTAADQDADKARGWDLGVDWYQTKPVTPSELLAVIRRLLQSAEEEAERGAV
jgi:DNA-binding response OmpR family regulator